MPLLALGPNIFEIDALNFQELESEIEVKWPAISRFGQAPGRQMTGYGEDPFLISGLIYPEDVGGREELELLKITAKLARPVMMIGWSTSITNAARVFGQVVILRVRDRQSKFGAAGVSQKITFEVECAPAGDNGPLAFGWF